MKRNSQARTTTFFIVAMITSVILITNSGTPIVMGIRGGGQAVLLPFQQAAVALSTGLSGTLDTLGSIGRLESENQSLRDRVSQLQQQVSQMQLAQSEDAQLRLLLGFQRRTTFHTSTARIVARDPEGLVRVVEVDRGSNDGIRPGMVVVAGAGLVGRVSDVFATSSRVRLIVDQDSRVNAVEPVSQVQGTLSGTGGALSLQLQPQPGADVHQGDAIVTSGLGGTFPPGLTVGQVAEYHRVDYEMVQTALVQPAVDFRNLQVVLIITDFQPSQ
ncbi:MAG: rod shape-determining protein MreC [Candidatus Dormibacteria bacterium]